MTIGFVTTHDPEDRRAYSGTTYRIRKAFEAAGAAVTPIGPLQDVGTWPLKAYKLALRSVGLEYERFRSPWLLRYYAQQLRSDPRTSACDVLFTPTGTPLAWTDHRPIAFWADATFEGLNTLYPLPRRFSRRAWRNGVEGDRHLLRRAVLAGYSSAWAAADARRLDEADPDRIAVVPYGSNVDAMPDRADVEERILARTFDRGINLLFVGKDYERKGGPLSIEAVRCLRDRGVDAHLTLVGPPPLGGLPEFVAHVGALDPARPQHRKRLVEIYSQAHLFLLPTRADCTPIVLGEAMSYGLPCISTDVGGVASLLTADVGLLLPLDADADAYASAIMPLLANEKIYRSLARGARARYDSTLNWDASARRFLDCLDNALRRSRRPSANV